MTYDEIVAQLQTMLEVPLNDADANFTRILPSMFLYAEGRIFGDLSLIITTVTQQAPLIALNRELVLPSSVIILEHINICSPVGAITNASKRTTLERVSPAALDMFWPQASFRPGVPQKYAIIGSVQLVVPPPTVPGPQVLAHVVRFMPTPDKAYMAELIGMIRPETLSPTNKQTILTIRYPELYLAACMVFGSGYQRDFGAQADDPARAQSWNGQYQALLDGARLEQARMRGEGPGFTAQPPAQIAQQPRSP